MQSSTQRQPISSLPILRRGSTGQDVRNLQAILYRIDYSIDIDGIFGTRTEATVKQFQIDHNLLVDGIVGPKTWSALYAEFALHNEEQV